MTDSCADHGLAGEPDPEASLFSRAAAASDFLRSQTPERPQIAVVLGSGLGGFTASIVGASTIPFARIPYFPRVSAEGHAGNLIFGRIGLAPVVVIQGRAHFYEGHSMEAVTFPLRALGCFGVRAILLTNAAGAVNPGIKPGSLAVLSDHINLMGANPLVGKNDNRWGMRFPDMSEAYSSRLRAIAVEEAGRLGLSLTPGIYAAVSGPNYETPAEIRFLRGAGADLVGMSTVPETLVARHMGIEVLAISCVTNMAAGIGGQPICHEGVLVLGAHMQESLRMLLGAIISRMQALLEITA